MPELAPRRLDVYFLPALVEPEELRGRTCVVIDVLRATTTIVHALAAGATEVAPCVEVEEARRVAAEIGPVAVLGGERAGGKINGFDLGNSPAEYTQASVGGKTLVFSTTNGTRALARCRQASRVLIGAFVNFSAICRELAGEADVAIVCAGTDGEVTREDALLAGAIVHDLATASNPLSGASGRLELNDQAEIAADAWRTAVRALTDRPLGMSLRESQGGRNLIGIGHETDIDLAAQIDRFDLAPGLDLVTGRIRRG
jgi:2-phosphosulfolactate phosphatase